MKVSDAMIEAAINELENMGFQIAQSEARAAIEAAINAHVPLTRSQAAKARWAKTSPMERHQHMKSANKKRHPDIEC